VVRNSQSTRVLTVAEVAERLRVCRATIYRLCSEGQLGHLRVSNAIRIPEKALRAYLAGHSTLPKEDDR
jgi:excisionase family DNA binding protein